jgi:hypothetical protein
VGPARLDRDPGQVEGLRDAIRNAAQGLGETLAAEQEPCHLGGQICLAPVALRFLRSRSGGAGKRRGDHRRDQKDRQRDPVLLVGNRESTGRGDVEEVEGGSAGDRGGDAERQAP